MLRIVSCVGLALLLLACGSTAPNVALGESVPLLTGDLGCYAGGEGGGTAPLLAEPRYGTSWFGKPLMWPSGYTARRAGSEVAVLDTQGRVKAVTGRIYHLSRAAFFGDLPSDAFPVAAECTYHHDFIDCTANPTDTWCLPVDPPTTTPTPPPSGA